MSIAVETRAVRRDFEVISLVGLAHGTSHFFHLLLPSLYPWLMKDFDLSFTQAGFLATVFFVVSGIGQALAGFVVDRLGARRVMMFGIGMLTVGSGLVALAPSYPGLIFAAGVTGLGNSIFHPADFTLLNRRVSTPRLGHAFSVHGLVGYIGWAAAPVFVTGLAGLWNWHAAAAGAAAVGGAVFVLLQLRRASLDDLQVQELVGSASSHKAEARAASQLAFLRSTAVWLSFMFFLLSTAAFGILQNFAPTVLGHVYGMPLALASAGLTAYLLGSAAGIIAGGFASTRFPDTDVVVAVMLGVAAVFALILATGVVPQWAVLACMAMMGFGVGVAGPNRDLLVRKAATSQFGKGSFGRVYGFVYSGLDVGLALAPMLIGPLLDAGRFVLGLYAIALFQIGALITALRVGARARASSVGKPVTE
ncbi:MAG: MFS transporter [Gemmatimonadota bacterium]